MNFSEDEHRLFGEGGDGGDPGSPDNPSVWLFGIEHGTFGNPENPDVNDGYPLSRQLKYGYNQNAFKLFAVIAGEDSRSYREFAEKHQPFVRGAKGYFKGNLYPQPCRSVKTWDEEAIRESGYQNKDDYVRFCKETRFPLITRFVNHYRPRLFIGVGAQYPDDFAQVVFGEPVQFEVDAFTPPKGNKKYLHTAVKNHIRLAVIPHLSGGPNGLNSYDSIDWAGERIRNLLAK